jgi:hypothetical protein
MNPASLFKRRHSFWPYENYRERRVPVRVASRASASRRIATSVGAPVPTRNRGGGEQAAEPVNDRRLRRAPAIDITPMQGQPDFRNDDR